MMCHRFSSQTGFRPHKVSCTIFYSIITPTFSNVFQCSYTPSHSVTLTFLSVLSFSITFHLLCHVLVSSSNHSRSIRFRPYRFRATILGFVATHHSYYFLSFLWLTISLIVLSFYDLIVFVISLIYLQITSPFISMISVYKPACFHSKTLVCNQNKHPLFISLSFPSPLKTLLFPSLHHIPYHSVLHLISVQGFNTRNMFLTILLLMHLTTANLKSAEKKQQQQAQLEDVSSRVVL
jgi:hypothetical protein